MGEGESLITESDFHSMNAVESTRAKLSTCASDCRGFERYGVREGSMVAIGNQGALAGL